MTIAEFANNNVLTSDIEMTSFFANKEYHSRMSFISDDIKYVIARDRIQVAKTKNIIDIMQNILDLARANVDKFKKVMKNQTDKYRKKVNYEIDDKIFLSSKNIIIDRLAKKLENKMLDLFSITKRIEIAFYKLKLSITIRIHNVFHASLLRKVSEDSLSGQVQESPDKIVTKKGDEK